MLVKLTAEEVPALMASHPLSQLKLKLPTTPSFTLSGGRNNASSPHKMSTF